MRRRSGRRSRRDREDPVEEMRERMARMNMMSGGLGPRDDDFIRDSRRGDRRGRSRRGRRYEDDESESESGEDFVYDRYGPRGRRGRSEVPRGGRSYRDRMAQMFGGGGSRYGF